MKKKCIGLIILLFVIVFLCFSLKNNKKDVNTKIVNYNGNNLKISIDGATANALPTSGVYYLVDYDCGDINTQVSWNNSNYTLNISNGINNGNVACYLKFKSSPFLSEMSVGSYVSYYGDSENGCDNRTEVNGYTACSGKNANYESDTDMGYCHSASYKFHVNGWKIAYIEDGSAHLVSAGAPECMCSGSAGIVSSSSCIGNLSSSNTSKHYTNMDNIALKYCNSLYSKEGICDGTTSWAMNATDFQKITGSTLSSRSCYVEYSNMACGYTNDLIDNGGYYWFATPYKSSSNYSFYWNPSGRIVNINNSNRVSGVRPVIKLDSSIIVTGGDGTYENPYIISVGE